MPLSRSMSSSKNLPEALKKMLGVPPSVLLFEGPQKTEIEETAFFFAQSLLKTEKKYPPDLRLFEIERKEGYHSIQAIKHMIEEAQIPPYESSHKVCMFYQAERMLPTSSNALLKILEEPPPQLVIILVTTHKAALLPTLVSRCLCVSFKKKEKTENLFLAETMFEIGLRLLKKDLPLSSEVPEVEDVETALSYLFYFYRDLLLIQLKGNPSALFFKDKASVFASIEEIAPPLSLVQEKIEKALLATTLHIPLKHALAIFL